MRVGEGKENANMNVNGTIIKGKGVEIMKIGGLEIILCDYRME